MIYDILPVNNYRGNSTTTQFDFNFYIENPDQLKVYLHQSNGIVKLLEHEIDYSINELKNPEGSYITFPLEGSEYSVLKQDETISIELYLPISQETQYNNSSLLNLSALEYSFDYLTRLIQILSRKIELCVKIDECINNTPDELLNTIYLKSKYVSDTYSELNNMYAEIQEIEQGVSDKYDTFVEEAVTREEINTALNSKANVTGDNFANSIKQFDSKWVASNTSFDITNAIGDHTYSLASYLPDDDYNYEVYVSFYAKSTATAGTNLKIKVPLLNSIAIPIASVSDGSRNAVNIFTMPIGLDRQFIVYNSTAVSLTCNINIFGYRRIGANA